MKGSADDDTTPYIKDLSHGVPKRNQDFLEFSKSGSFQAKPNNIK